MGVVPPRQKELNSEGAPIVKMKAGLTPVIVPLMLSAFAALCSAQDCPVTTDAATYPNPPLTYPMTSDRYAVQYQLSGSGTFTNAQVYISYYGGTNSSPFLNASRYPADESLSFVSIPAAPGTAVAIRVTKIFGSNFPAIGQMSVRPAAKGIQISSVSPTVVQFATTTAADFAGDQFILHWNGTATQSGAIQGLAIFLNPPYTRPTGSNVKVIGTPSDLTGDLSSFDTLDIESTVAVASTGAVAFIVPANINNIFLGPGAWLQGKLRFTESGVGNIRRIYGPGVLDGSRFNYMNRHCSSTSDHPDDGYQSISWIRLPNKINGVPTVADGFIVDGPILSDNDFYATDWFDNTTINNLKIIGWNGNNDGIQMGITVRVSNVFIHTGDDSLKMWGSYITVTNATVWQGWNGGVINLGWFDNSPGDDCVIDSVYVVETDWSLSNTPSFTSTTLNFDNSAIVASLMVPGTVYGGLIPSVFRNIYVEDPPRVLFSLKITPSVTMNAPTVDLTLPGVLNLNLENIFTPASKLQNSIGFQTVDGTPLTGTMNIGLTNVMITPPGGTATALTGANAAKLGDLVTNGANVDIAYATAPIAATPPVVNSGGVLNDAGFTVGAPVAPGSIASVFGTGFGTSTSGVTVLAGGIAAPLFGVYGTQINFQVPWQLSGQTQTALTVTSGDRTSASITVPLADSAPGIFLLNPAGQGAVEIAGTALIAAPAAAFAGSRPAQRGEYITIFCTGLGAVTNQPATGALALVNPVSSASGGPVTVSIGGVNATPSFSGLAPGFLGLYQINVQVPPNAPIGPAVPLTISVGGTTSNQATIAIAAAGS
jgi:uncharacterized protein (TIGR03437 family)